MMKLSFLDGDAQDEKAPCTTEDLAQVGVIARHLSVVDREFFPLFAGLKKLRP